MDEYSAGLTATYPVTYRRNADDSLVDPTAPFVLLTTPAGTALPSGATTPPAWEQRAYTLRERVTPSTPGSYEWECTATGTAGATEPAWPATPTPGTTTVTDGTVTWTCRHANSSKKITPTRVSLGQYTWSWTVPTGAPVGVYTWTAFGTIEGVSCESDLQQLEVVSPGGGVYPVGHVYGYCTIAQVRAKLPAMAKSASPISDDDIEDIIIEVSSEIDAALSKRYALPIDDPPQLLRLLCKRLVCAEILDVRQSGDTKAQEVPLSVRLNKHAGGILESLRCGRIVLPGVPFIPNVAATSSLPCHRNHLKTFDGRRDNDPHDRFPYGTSGMGFSWQP